MQSKEYLKEFKKITKQMYKTTKLKNKDYAGENTDDAFKNFRVIEQLGGATTEQGFLTRISDKFTRIINLTKQDNHVHDEKITDTLIDMANYCILFKLYLDEKNRGGVIGIDKAKDGADKSVRMRSHYKDGKPQNMSFEYPEL